LPVVISVTKQAEVSKNLSIGNIYKAYDKKIFVWMLQDLELGKNEVGLAGSMTAVKKTFLPNSFAKGVILAGSVEEITEELVNELYDKHILRE
ncbi:MAG: electron transfer flavoprotein beta subunit/FixA family protein, partial [Lachnospiraceae bacterium]